MTLDKTGIKTQSGGKPAFLTKRFLTCEVHPTLKGFQGRMNRASEGLGVGKAGSPPLLRKHLVLSGVRQDPVAHCLQRNRRDCFFNLRILGDGAGGGRSSSEVRYQL